MGLNSLKDKKLIVVHFDGGDNGEVETFLGMDSVYTETAYGTYRHDYGAKYNDVARPKISVMKINGKDFTVAEVRDFLKWTTGVRTVSYLDILVNNTVRCSFLGRVINILQHKLDARTIGFTIEFESTGPWAWSPQQFVRGSFEQKIVVDNNGVITKNDSTLFNIDNNGVLSNNYILSIDNNGVAYIDNSTIIEINNLSDDLYTCVNLDVTFTNNNSDYLSIKNTTLNEETIIEGMSVNEVIKLHSGQFITSDVPYKLFGNSFNFVWPRLAPGINNFIIGGTGSGSIEFTYRYPIKIGDMAINVNVYGNGIECGDCFGGDDTSIFGQIDWNDIINTPTTLDGYGIMDAYTTVEVDEKIEDINLDIDETELEEMLTDVLDD